MNTKDKPYIGGWIHVREQMLDRFDEDINLIQFYKKYVVKKRYGKFNKKGILVREGEKVFVYVASNRFIYPCTVYKINRRKGKIAEKHKNLVGLEPFINQGQWGKYMKK
jgi:hypothetical protein